MAGWGDEWDQVRESQRINNMFFAVVLNLDGTLKTVAFKIWEKESSLAKTCRRKIRGCCAGEWRDTASVTHCPRS